MNRRAFAMGLFAATSAMAITHTAVAQSAMAPGAIPAPQYLTMAMKGGYLLEETGRIAFDKTGDPGLRRFSRAEVVEQVNLGDKLKASSESESLEAMRPGGMIGGLVAAPFAIAGGVVGATGSIVGLRRDMPMSTDAQKAQMIAQLQALPAGPQFDAMFVRVQLMGHQEAFAIHDGYARDGDDPMLRRIARGALPLIRQHIALLSRLQGGGMGMPEG